MLKTIQLALFAVPFAGVSAPAQTPRRVLEITSVRKHSPSATHVGITVSGNKVDVVNFTLPEVISDAYNLRPYQILGGPDWMNSESYDIFANSVSHAELTRDQASAVIQAVLASRFQLQVHRETKDIPAYSLVVGKSGSKLKESAPGAVFDPRIEFALSGMSVSNPKSTMAQLVAFLASQTDRPVLDRTGLTGYHRYGLDWNSENDPNSAGLSIFTAIQEQLGLKLESARGPVEMLVIDHAERPSEN